MKIIRKYTAIRLETTNVDDYVNVKLTYGEISGPHYNLQYPTEEFDSEDEAIEYAYKSNKYHKWLIVPIIKFKD